LKQDASIVIVPSTVLETMQLGSVAELTALTTALGKEQASKQQESEPSKRQ